MTLLILPFLEIKKFDATGKNEQEEDNPADMNSSNNRKEVILITKVLFQVFLQFHGSITWYLQFCTSVT